MPATKRPVQPEDLYKFVTVGDAQISPDGSRVAYVATTIDAQEDEARSAIWVVPAAGGDPRQFTSGARADSAPRWSPGGDRLAFISTRDGRPQLYVMAADGGEPRRLTNLSEGAGAAEWSPDGTRLAFTAPVLRDEAPKDPKERERWNQRPRFVDSMKYKRDGAGFTYNRRTHVFVVSAGGGEPRQITSGDYDDRDPTWSPDGRTVVFASARHESRELDSLSDLYAVDADGGQPRSLVRMDGIGAPSFSPDGSTIAFYATTPDGRDRSAHSHVWVVSAEGGEPRDLTPDFDRGVALVPPPMTSPRPGWTGDGKRVLFCVPDSGNVNLHWVRVADGTRGHSTRGERQLVSWTLAPGTGRVAFAFTDGQTPSDVAVIEVDGGGERRLTNANAALLEELQYTPPQRRHFDTPHGQVQGWVMRSPGDGAPGPLLLDIHGGPHGFFGSNFPLGTLYWLVAACRGWTVLAINPTGSTSYGRDFAHRLVGQWGEHDLPEQMAAVDALVAEGIADPERLAVTGYSYGGYMTSWVVGHTNRFKAAVIGAPLMNI
jgi:dipeptidyl aminopeptidase/acylaminoacyl peptidase